jgi:hypothetical protein
MILSPAAPTISSPTPPPETDSLVSKPESPSELVSARLPQPRRKRPPKRLRPAPRSQLTVALILTWADEHHDRTGSWPRRDTGPIHANRRETWETIQWALRKGIRGLPGGTTLAKVLAEHRGVRNVGDLPRLRIQQVLAWADAWHARSGQWPRARSGQEVPEAPGERWSRIDQALRFGLRALPGGDSLARLLARERGARNIQVRPRLTEKQILLWCKAHHRRTGAWPTYSSGAVVDAPGESWYAIKIALRKGGRGLPGGSSLARLLGERLGVRNKTSVPRLTVGQILKWADAHKRRTGRWPGVSSGRLADAPEETWLAIDTALRDGGRGLPRGDSLARLLARRRGARNNAALPPLTESMILWWADKHHQRRRSWPKQNSGRVVGAPGETWCAIQDALRVGRRGLAGGDSIVRLLARHGRDW